MLQYLIFLLSTAHAIQYTIYPNQYIAINNIYCNGEYNIDLNINSDNGAINYYFIPKAICNGDASSYVIDLSLIKIISFNGILKANLNAMQYCVLITTENLIESTNVNIISDVTCNALSNTVIKWWLIFIIVSIICLPCILFYYCIRKRRQWQQTRDNLGKHQIIEAVTV